MTTWQTEKATLDIDTYLAELSPNGSLSLVAAPEYLPGMYMWS